MASRKVFVVGVGMTKFEKPGRRDNFDYPDMARESVTAALKDAGVSYSCVDQAVVGYVYGESTCGQRALYEIGMTGIPVYNVNNACSTGSTALMMGKQLVEGGHADCVIAVGFEKMERGSLTGKFGDRINPMDKHVQVMMDTHGMEASPLTPQMFGNAGREHMDKYGSKPEHFAKIAHKNHLHSTNNPNSQFQDRYSLEQIMSSKEIHYPLTKLQCSPTSDGSAAAVLCNENFIRRHGLHGKAVEIVAMEMRTDFPSTFDAKSCMKMVGYDLTKAAADAVFKQTGYSRDDIDVVELHDCFSTNELITYEALGLCPEGKGAEMVDRGDNTYGGKYVVNPSGGLISKGHPLGATGLAQCAELCWQLRGVAGKRQVPGAKLGLQHNLGLGGACVVTLYRLGYPDLGRRVSAVPAAASGDVKLQSDEVFAEIKKTVDSEGEIMVKKVKGIFLFKITGPKGAETQWLVDLKNGKGSVERKGGKAEVTIKVKDADFMDLVAGKLTPQKAFFSGKLKMAGNTALALKLQSIIPRPEGAKL